MLTESYEYVQFRTADSLTKVKEKTRLAKAYSLQLVSRLEDLRNDAQATDIEVNTAVNRKELMIEHQQSQQLARLSKLKQIKIAAEAERFERTKAQKVEKKLILTKSKVKKRLLRAKQLLEGQRAERKVMWMCYGVLHMSKARLEGKLVRLESAFGTRDEEIVAEKYTQALIRERMYRVDIEAKLSQLAKLETAHSEIARELVALREAPISPTSFKFFEDSFQTEGLRRLHHLEDKVLKDSESLLARQIDVSAYVSTLVAILKKVKAADPYQRLMVCPVELLEELAEREISPDMVAQTLLVLEKAVVTALEIPKQRLKGKKKLNAVNNTVKLMIENTLNRRRNTIIEAKSKELFAFHFLTKEKTDSPEKKMNIAEDLLKNVVSLEALASSHSKNTKSLGQEVLSVNLDPAELEDVENERKLYKTRVVGRVKSPETVPTPRPTHNPREKNKTATELYAARELFEIDKKRRAMKSHRRTSEVNLKTETADFFLNIKRDR